MMANLYRCYNCENAQGLIGYDFTAAAPVCPKCGADGTTLEAAQKIVTRQAVHFDPPHGVLRDKGTGKRACDGKPTTGLGVHSTGVPTAVTCPACRESEAFKPFADVKTPVPEHLDMVIDPPSGL